MSRPLRLLNYFLSGVLFICLIAWATNTYADDDYGSSSTTSTVNEGSNFRSKSYGFGHSLGDIDLNQCMGSTQWATILVSRQKLVLNKWCAAESYDSRGLHLMAAVLRCDISDIAKHFTNSSECITANTMHPTTNEIPEPTDIGISDEDEDNRIDELYARLITLENHKTQDAEIAQKAAQRARASAIQVQQAETSRKELAQSMLDELREYK